MITALLSLLVAAMAHDAIAIPRHVIGWGEPRWHPLLQGDEVLVRRDCVQDRYFRDSCRLFAVRDDGSERDLIAEALATGLLIPDYSDNPPVSFVVAAKIARIRQLGHYAKALKPIAATSKVPPMGYANVEGKILSVGETRRAYYLNFGSYWKEDFTIILRRTKNKGWTFEGLAPSMLDQQCVRVVGKIEEKDGPMIQLESPDQLIVLPQDLCG